MKCHVGQLVRRQREKLGLNRGQVAMALGYKNIAKGIRRIMQVESGECIEERFWAVLSRFLALDEAEVAHAAKLDHEAYEAWLDEPGPLMLIVSYGSHVFQKVVYQMPEEAANDQAKAEEFARETARRLGRQATLYVSRRVSIWFDENGNARRSEACCSPPGLYLKCRKFRFALIP